MSLTHTVTCDGDGQSEEVIILWPTGVQLPEGWKSVTIISSDQPESGLTFYRCPGCCDSMTLGEFVRRVLGDGIS